MNFILQPWQLLFVALSGWVSQRQIIEFQNSEIITVMQSQGRKRIRLSPGMRQRSNELRKTLIPRFSS